MWGYLFWNEVPGITTIVGVLMLILSSLYVWHRERQLEKTLSHGLVNHGASLTPEAIGELPLVSAGDKT